VPSKPERIRRFDRARLTRWSNGTGDTRELIRSPSAGPSFDWRISVADVEIDGSFSVLPGIDRTIVLCEGRAMVLIEDGRRIELQLRVPYSFSGDSLVGCRVPHGPTRDLNIMSDRRTTAADTQIVQVVGDHAIPSDCSELVLVALTPGIAVRSSDNGEVRELATYDVVLGRNRGCVHLVGHGTVVAARFRSAGRDESRRGSGG
jgi:uncharacterized protein